MVFPHHRAVLRLDALAGDAGAEHLRQPVDVHRVDAGPRLDVLPHRLGPGLGAEDAHRQAHRARVDAFTLELLDDHLHVARRDHDDVRREIADELHLLLGLPAAHRHVGATESLRAIVRAEAAGEEAVAVGHVHDVAGAAAGGADRARDERRPHVDVGLRVADHGGLARRTRRRVHADDALARHGEHAERIVVAQILLGGEREARQVGEGVEIRRMHASQIEGAPVVRHVLVGVAQAPAQPLELQRLQFVATGGFDWLQIAG